MFSAHLEYVKFDIPVYFIISKELILLKKIIDLKIKLQNWKNYYFIVYGD